MSRTLAPCGTVAAYNRHLRRGETPCDACREANTARYQAYMEQLGDYGKRQRRIDSQAAARATSILRQRHRDEYRALYQAEKRRLAQEARSAARSATGTHETPTGRTEPHRGLPGADSARRTERDAA